MDEQMRTRVLLVEDDDDLRLITLMQLEQCGYEAVGAANGRETLETLNQERVDIILLDVMLPDCDGHELCSRIRSEEIGYHGPVIFLSCLGDGDNIVEAFRKGGNDYIVKPAKMDTLKERIEVNLEKAKKQEAANRKKWYRHFVIDQATREVFQVEDGIQKEKVVLSPKEYRILESLVTHEGEVVLYRQLYRDVWEQDDLDDFRTLMVHVSNLRKKLVPDNMNVIRSVRGIGYLFQDE